MVFLVSELGGVGYCLGVFVPNQYIFVLKLLPWLATYVSQCGSRKMRKRVCILRT